MRVLSGIVWGVVAAFAGLLGAFLISDEPGATAARWYFGFAVLAALMGIASLVWHGARARSRNHHPRRLDGERVRRQ